MPWSGRLSCTLLAALAALAGARAANPTPTPTPAPTPVPNEVDLAKFKGRYRGTSKVSLDSGVLYTGQSKTRLWNPAANSLEILIEAALEANGRRIPIGNRLRFTADGVVSGKRLAPGVLAKARFDGLYLATPRRITFSGTYEVRKLTGRFTGSLSAGKQGRFTLRYSIFPGESVVAAYTYQYSGKARR